MLWKRLIKPRGDMPLHVLAVIGFTTFFLLTRLPRLGTDIINPDGVNWHYRSEQFIVGLKTKQFEKTYQHYHPGVTLMWIAGVSIELLRQISPLDRVYTHYNFEIFHFIAKYSLVFVQLFLSIITIYLLTKVLGFKKAFLTVCLFSFEPFFLGNSRLLHLDVLLSLFLFNGLLLGYLGMLELSLGAVGKPFRHLVYNLGVGSFLALGFLTKSVGILGLVYVVGCMAIRPFVQSLRKRQGSWQYTLLHLGFVVIAFGFVLFIVFPALWKAPVAPLLDIFDEAERVGVRKGHGQIVLGEYTRDAGIIFYPLVLLMKLSPFTVVGVLVGVWGVWQYARASRGLEKLQRHRGISLLGYLSFFYLGYLALMTFPTKKIDRYMLPMFPYLCLVAVFGYEVLLVRYRRSVVLTVVLAMFLFLFYPAAKLFPYYFTYTSPVFGNATYAHKIIAQKPFGVGVHDLKEYILSTYGYYPALGFYDVKPMRAIYKNSRIFDIRESGTSNYDLLILGPNEEMPEKVLKSDAVFVLQDSIYINGLEYWKIYGKENSQ